jgi:PBP1b-binding outer membrane lipoprotein LpoB
MNKRIIAVAVIALALSACSTTKPTGEVTEDGVKLAKNFGKVEVSFSTFGEWKSIKSSASATVPIEHDAGIEQAMNLATMRAKRNIVEFIQSDLKSKKTTDSMTDALVDHNVNKDKAAKLSTKITESIVEESAGIVRGAYIDDRRISDDGKNVTVTIIVDKRSLESSSKIRALLNANAK